MGGTHVCSHPGASLVSGDIEVIKRIVDAFERSDWSEIDVRAGSLRIHLSTTIVGS